MSTILNLVTYLSIEVMSQRHSRARALQSSTFWELLNDLKFMVATTRSGAKVSSNPPGKGKASTATLQARKKPKPKATLPTIENDTAFILSILHTFLSDLKSAESTICPSQVARRMHELQPAQYSDWRAMMDTVRDVVWGQVAEGRVEVTQGGVVRSPEEREGLKGPIRVRRGQEWAAMGT